MESVFILIPISLVIVGLIAIFFWWSAKNGQFDDLEGPGFRVIMDDDTTDKLDSNRTNDDELNNDKK